MRVGVEQHQKATVGRGVLHLEVWVGTNAEDKRTSTYIHAYMYANIRTYKHAYSYRQCMGRAVALPSALCAAPPSESSAAASRSTARLCSECTNRRCGHATARSPFRAVIGTPSCSWRSARRRSCSSESTSPRGSPSTQTNTMCRCNRTYSRERRYGTANWD